MTTEISRRIAIFVLSRIRSGSLTVVENGERTTFGTGAPSALVEVKSRQMWRKLMRGSRGLAESYVQGMWETPDLTAVIRVAARNVEGLDAWRRRWSIVRVPYQRVRTLFLSNTPRRSRKDIEAHYDLGNDMFEAMLDPTMMYSSAYFERPGMTLEEASKAKLELICEKLQLSASDHVLEIGTGWGGFAMYAAATRGCRVTTTTISKEQRALAIARIEAAGLSDQITVLPDDYRELTGQYDKLVSIEMIEAVGWKHFDTFFKKCSNLLRPDGAMLLQAIVHDDRAYHVEKASKSSFIRTYIFPNGCLPSLAVIAKCLDRKTNLRAVDMQDLTPHYADTLRRWRANFNDAAAELRQRGYDERFQRLWRMYLSYCEAGFAERRIAVVQQVFAKPRWTGTIGPGVPTDR
ncbi:MAG TPA: cyclopropane-fatty-acyl-phospholipid synthase family protein [Baekduia sp.]|nr:cyclopropane-fatty-acyl-phospholipid synthase family protein [Baekduia sp.]